jgi:alkaline phosphatase
MTHSIDSFITDSANSATALYTGHKSTVNCLGVYADSSPNVFDDPKVETIAELFHRLTGGAVGIVSTAFIADATPAALVSHTRDRNQAAPIIDWFLNGIQNYTWTNWTGPDVLFGGGAENFYPPSLGGKTFLNRDYYQEFSKKGYAIAQNKTSLTALKNDTRALGIFSVSNMAKWLDRNVYKNNLKNQNNTADGLKKDATDQPGLLEMTIKAIDILSARSKDKGFFLMSEAASVSLFSSHLTHPLNYQLSNRLIR